MEKISGPAVSWGGGGGGGMVTGQIDTCIILYMGVLYKKFT